MRQITPRELAQLATQWYERGELTFLEHCLISMPAEMSISGKMDPDQPFDPMAYFQQIALESMSRGDPESRLKVNHRVLQFLRENLD